MCERAVTEFDLRGADDYVKCVSVTMVWSVLRLRMEEIGLVTESSGECIE